MSSVDERIVEMRFENDQFESGVKTSLKTLDKLKAGLNLDGAADGLQNLQTTAKGFDISNISEGVDKITQRFSLLGIMADQAIRVVTNGLISMGQNAKEAIESLTVDQIGVGFNKYERKIQSVQTIMNATGKDIDTVNQSLDKLNWYTDETSYSYADMVDNISKFTSSGIQLEDATTSMIGIANAAGLAGANVQDASHAMEGFSKAMGQGYMSRQNWQWIRTAHMDTVQFKESMIDAAVQSKTLAKVIDKQGNTAYYVADKNGRAMKKYAVSVEDFETNLAKGWLTKDVMNTALADYGGFTEQIYEQYLKTGDLTSDIIARLGEGTDNLGLRAFRASQEAKTFSDAINSVKDAVSTGWMVSFEQIFGNYEEAKKLWTTVANELWDVFASGGEHRNEMLKEWHETGGYDTTLKAIRNIWDATKSMGKAVKETFSEFFPPMTAERLKGLTDSLYDFSVKFKKAFDIRGLDELPEKIKAGGVELEEWIEKNTKATKNLKALKNAFSGLFSIVKLGKFVLSSFGKVLSPLKRLFGEAGKSLFELSGNLGKFITNVVDSIVNSEKYAKIIDKLTSYVDKFTSFILDSAKGVKDFVNAFIKSDGVQNFFDKIRNGSQIIKNYLSPYIDKAKEKIDKFFNSLTGLSSEDIDRIISKITNSFEKFSNKVKDVYNQIKNFLSPALDVLKSAYEKVQPYIQNAVDSVKQFWDRMIVGKEIGPQITTLLGKFKNKFEELCDVAKTFIENFSFKDLWKNVKSFFAPVMEKIDTWVDDIKQKLENLDLGKLAAVGLVGSIIPTIISIGVAFAEAARLLKASKGLVTNLNDILNKFKAGFKSRLVETAKAVTIFAAAIGILAASFKLISTVDSDKVQSSLNVLKWFGGGLAGITAAFGLMSRFNLIGDVKNIGLAMLELSASLAVLSASFILLDKVNPENITRNLLVLVTLSTMLMTISGLLGKFVPQMSKGSLAMLSFAGGVLILVEAVKRMSEVDASKIESSLGAIMIIAGIMATLSAIGGKVKFGSGFGMLGMVGSIFVLLKLFEKLSDESIQTISEKAKKNIGFIVATLGALAALAAIGWLGGDHAAKTGVAILAMSASVLIIYEAVKKLGEMDTEVLAKGGIAVAAIMAFFALLSKTTMYSSANSAKAGLAILEMASALLVVYLAVKKLGELDPEVMITGLVGVISLLGTFALLMRSMRNLKGVNGTFGALIGMAVTIGTIAAALSYLTLFSVEDLAKSVITLGTTLVAFAGALKIASGVKFDRSSAAGLIGGLVALTGVTVAMKVLASENWASLTAAAAGISGCLLAIAKAMNMASKTEFSKNTALSSIIGIIVGCAALWAISAILAPLADKPWDGMLAAAGSISLVLLAVVGAADIMALGAKAVSKVPFGAFAAGLGKMLLAIAAIAAVFFAISWVIGQFDLSTQGKIVQGAETIGKAIGGFLGSIVGEGMESAASHLEEIGNHLSKFMENAGGFFDGVSNLPENTGKNLLDLSKALSQFSRGDFWDSVRNKINGSGLENLGSQLENLGKALQIFSNTTANVDLGNISSAVEAGNMLNDLLKSLDKSGGSLQRVFGSRQWSSISTGLEEFGTAMSKLSEHGTSGEGAIKLGNIKNAVAAGAELNNLLSALPKEPGALLKAFGKEGPKWSTLAKGLEEFGDALAGLSVHGTSGEGSISVGNIQNAVTAGAELNKLLSALPKEPGAILRFFGNEGPNWNTIGDGLTAFGQAMAAFSTTISGDKFGAEFDIALEKVAKLPEMFDLLRGQFGDYDSTSSINHSIVDLGTSLTKFNDSITELKAENIEKVRDFLSGIKVMTQDFISAGTEMGTALKDSLAQALKPADATNIGTEYMSGLVAGIKKSPAELQSTGKYMAQLLVNSVQSLADQMTTVANEYVTNFTSAISSGGAIGAMMAGLALGSNAVSGLNLAAPQMAAASALLAQLAITSLSNASGEMNATGLNLGKQAVTGLSKSNSNMNTTGKTLGSKAVSGVKIAESGFAAVGSNAGSALAGALGAKAGAAYAAGYSVASAAISGAKAAAQIASPSKVFTRMGEYCGEGLVNGFTNSTASVREASAQLAKESLLASADVLKEFDSITVNSIDSQPVITPILDLTNIEYEAQRLNGVLNGSTSISLSERIETNRNDTNRMTQKVEELIMVGSEILSEIREGHDLYFDDGAFAGRINRRLGVKI